MVKKRGRPCKKGGSVKERRLRELWRGASKRYYTKNQKKVLARAKK